MSSVYTRSKLNIGMTPTCQEKQDLKVEPIYTYMEGTRELDCTCALKTEYAFADTSSVSAHTVAYHQVALLRKF